MSRVLGPCLLCGARAVELHHWTGSLVPDGPHLDEKATIPLCFSCHHAEHAAWREQGIESFRDPLEARLVRLSWLWQRLADLAEHGAPRTLDAPSQRGVHLVVLGITEDLARRCSWEVAS